MGVSDLLSIILKFEGHFFFSFTLSFSPQKVEINTISDDLITGKESFYSFTHTPKKKKIKSEGCTLILEILFHRIKCIDFFHSVR